MVGFVDCAKHKLGTMVQVLTVCLLLGVHTMTTLVRSTYSAEDRRCKHTFTRKHEVFYDVDIEPEHVIRRRSVSQQLRIHVHYDSSINSLPLEHSSMIKMEVKNAVDYWERTLRVRPTGAPIRLRRQCGSLKVKYYNQRAYCVKQCSSVTVCGDIRIPEPHLEGCYFWDPATAEFKESQSSQGPGVDQTDFILYIASIQSYRCQKGRTVSYAAHCQQERVLDRPVAGYFSICPQSISDSWQERQQLLSTMKHEILHALGFTAGLFAFYRDSNGNPLTPRSNLTGKPESFDGRRVMYVWSDRVVRKFRRTDWAIHSGPITKEVNMMVTDRVKKEVREHFGCETLEGAELEDQGIDGTAITHWEKRVFENEAMTGIYTENSVISRITLALMEDTGWYQANYSMVGDYEWGKGLGCEFVNKSCYHWISTRLARNESIYPYCQRVKRGELLTDCTHNHHAVALCNLVEYKTELPDQYQYFSANQLEGVRAGEEKRYGGSVTLADYCPYLQEFSWTSKQKTIRGSSCIAKANALNEKNNFFGERYGKTSRCFKHQDKWLLYKCDRISTPQHSGSGCYQVSCNNKTGLSFSVGDRSYPCYYSGYVHRVIFTLGSGYLHNGSIVCPACADICPDLGFRCPPDQVAHPSPQVHLPIPCRAALSQHLLPVVAFIFCLIISSVLSSQQHSPS